MALEQRSKVAARRLRASIAGLVQRGRGLHEAMADLEHRERCERLIAAMPRVRSPKPTLLRATAAPEPSAVLKPLVFRKTKRELQREREAMELERVAAKRQRREGDREGRARKTSITKEGATAVRRPIKCARVLFATTCRQYLQRARAARLAGRSRPRRRLLF